MKLSDKKFYQKVDTKPTPKLAPSASEFFDILAQQFGPNMPPPADPNAPPVQDKVQQYKDMGLNDQQVEQVMKMAAPPPEEQQETEVPPEHSPEEIAPPVVKPAPYQTPDLNQQQPEEAPLDVKDLMMNQPAEQKKQVVLSFLGHVQKLHDAWQRIYTALEGVSHSPGPKVYKDWNEQWDEYQQIQKALTNPEELAGLPPATQQALRTRLQDLKKQLPEQHSMLPKGSPQEKKALQRQLKALQVQISKAGSMYKKLFRLMQPTPAKPGVGTPGQPGYKPPVAEQPGMPETEALQWLQQQVSQMAGQPKPMEMPPEAKPEPIDIGDKEVKRVDQQGKPLKQKTQSLGGDTLSTPEMDGTGKIGQQMRTPGDPQWDKGYNVMKETNHGTYRLTGQLKVAPGAQPMIEVMYAPRGSGKFAPIGTGKTKEEANQIMLQHHDRVQAGLGAKRLPLMAQQMPGAPGGTPNGPPMPPAPPGPGGGQPMDPGMVEDKAEDPRPLEEILEEMKADFEALSQKIQSGDAILDGQEVEPVETDSGAMPSPAPMIASEKEAVDENAKEYYHDYYGGYGDAMTKDRVAEIVDLIDETAADYGVVLTNKQVRHLTSAIELSGFSGGPLRTKFADRALVNYIFKTGQVFHISAMLDKQSFWQDMRLTALNALPPELKTKWDLVVKAANMRVEADSKIKKPKINEQQPDAEKVENLKDKADGENDRVRPAHLKVELEDHCVEGAYLKMTLKWDPSDEAAKRSDEGLKQMVLSHVKGLESKKEFIDFGWLGQISFDEFDPEAGMAVVSVRTKKPGDAPTHVKTSS